MAFEGGYHMDCLLHEIRGKKYNKKWLLFKHYFLMFVSGTILTLGLLFIK